MARFRTLSEAINFHLEQAAIESEQLSADSYLAVFNNNHLPIEDAPDTGERGFFRWGISIWGVDVITGEEYPMDFTLTSKQKNGPPNNSSGGGPTI
jgi:hypothetical protein